MLQILSAYSRSRLVSLFQIFPARSYCFPELQASSLSHAYFKRKKWPSQREKQLHRRICILITESRFWKYFMYNIQCLLLTTYSRKISQNDDNIWFMDKGIIIKHKEGFSRPHTLKKVLHCTGKKEKKNPQLDISQHQISKKVPTCS